MKTMSSAEAQNHFGALLDTVQREPVTITRRGRPVALLISPQDFQPVSQESSAGGNTALSDAWRSALAAFRGQGLGGSTKRLLSDREDDKRSER